MYEKSIVYSPDTRDFAFYLDGELCGFARTYQEAEEVLNELVYELLHRELYADIDTGVTVEVKKAG